MIENPKIDRWYILWIYFLGMRFKIYSSAVKIEDAAYITRHDSMSI